MSMKKSLLYVSALMLFYALGIVQALYVHESWKMLYAVSVGLLAAAVVLYHVFRKT